MSKKNEIEIIYKLRSDSLRIFGKKFVNNNKDKCEIIYDGKIYKLTQFCYDIDKNYKEKDLFIIKLRGINNIYDSSYMFFCCESLISLPDIS